MSSTSKTPNYQLSQWQQNDMLTHGDVNEDNAKIDAAIKTVADTASLVHNSLTSDGYCRIAAGTYTGTGTFGAAHPNTLSFNFTPKFFLEFPANDGFWAFGHCFSALWGVSATPYSPKAENYRNTKNVSYSGNTITWYEVNTPEQQSNLAGVVYGYVAIG